MKHRIASAAAVLVVILNAIGPAVAQAPASGTGPQPPAVESTTAPATSAPDRAPATPPGTSDEPAPPTTPAIGTATLPQDLSPWGMFINADMVVKAVMLGLAFASFVTWTVWLAKSWELLAAKGRARRAISALTTARTVSEARYGKAKGPVARLIDAADTEMKVPGDFSPEGLKERIAWQLERIEVNASRSIGRGMGVLATIGATAPFVGLFGTVWGIMNSFIGISRAHTTNLAVVAPGIAEALLATALGLVAAIPAVVIYNVFARQIGGYRALLSDASALVMRLVSRDCERRHSPLSRAAE